MEERVDLEKEVKFLKMRLEQTKRENELIKKDNKSLREEMTTLKSTVTNIVLARPRTAVDKKQQSQQQPQQNEQQLRYVLEYQRTKLEELENDLKAEKWKNEQLQKTQIKRNDSLQNDNEVIQPESVRLANMYAGSSEYVVQLKRQNEELEGKLKALTQMYATEIAQLKTTVAKQDAVMISSISSTNAIANANAVSQQNRSRVSLDPLNHSSYVNKTISTSAIMAGQRHVEHKSANSSFLNNNNDGSLFSYSSKRK